MSDPLSVALRPRDLVRLTATASARQRTPWNLEHPWGVYERAWSQQGRIYYARAGRTVPPYVMQTAVTSGPGDTHPRMAYDQRQTLHLLFQRGSGSAFNAYEVQSNDDGATWGAEALAFSGGKYPTVAMSPFSGIIVRAAWVSNLLYGTQQTPGETSPGAQFAFSGVGSVADDTFQLAPAYDAPHRWLLTVRLLGASEISDFESFDDCRTWSLVS